jgi:hypothetical protein
MGKAKPTRERNSRVTDEDWPCDYEYIAEIAEGNDDLEMLQYVRAIIDNTPD